MATLKKHGREFFRVTKTVPATGNPDLRFKTTLAYMADGTVLRKVDYLHSDKAEDHSSGWVKESKYLADQADAYLSRRIKEGWAEVSK